MPNKNQELTLLEPLLARHLIKSCRIGEESRIVIGHRFPGADAKRTLGSWTRKGYLKRISAPIDFKGSLKATYILTEEGDRYFRDTYHIK